MTDHPEKLTRPGPEVGDELNIRELQKSDNNIAVVFDDGTVLALVLEEPKADLPLCRLNGASTSPSILARLSEYAVQIPRSDRPTVVEIVGASPDQSTRRSFDDPVLGRDMIAKGSYLLLQFGRPGILGPAVLSFGPVDDFVVT